MFVCLFVCFAFFSYFLTVSFVFRESPRTVMVTAAGWEFCGASALEPILFGSFLHLFPVKRFLRTHS